MYRWFLVLVSSAAICLCQQPEADRVETATVNILASTTFGESLGEVRAVLSSVGPQKEYKEVGENIRFAHIPYGLYDLELRAPGFNTRRERLAIYQAEISYRVGLALAPPHSTERTEISGSVSQVPSDAKDLWVRLVSLYASDLIETRLDASNSFRLVGLSPGRYILLLLDKGRVINSQAVDFFGGKLTLKVTGARAERNRAP